MAKKKELKTDDFDFGEDLDFPDFNFDGPDVKDDRNPATKIKDGAIAGAKETIKSPAFIANMVRKALPVGYGSIMDLTDQGADSIKSIYSDTVKEIKPVIKDIKRTVKKIMPSAESVLPKAMADKIKKWSESDPETSYRGESAENQRDAALQMQLGDIFKFQTISELKNKSEADAKDSIKDGIEFTRHKDSLGQLDSMRISLQQLAGYQSKIESNFQKKSLELQFRHYFVAVDSLQEQKRQNAVVTTSMEGILKNTGLPEFAKLHQYERLKEVLRNKFIEGAADTIFNKRRNFISNITKNVGAAAKDRVSRFVGGIREGLGGAEMMIDAGEQAREMGGPGGLEMGANMVGGAAAGAVGNRAGKWVYDNVASKNKNVVKVGNKAQHFVENFPQLATDWARSQQGESGGMLDPFLRFIKGSVLSASTGMDTELTADKTGSMQNPDIFGRQTNKSITEIIPGYLSRIYQELQIMRTGNTKLEMTTYDFETNKFNNESSVRKNIFKSIVSDSSKKITRDEIDNLLKTIDPDGTKLTPEQRKILGDQLLNDNLKNTSGSTNRLKTTSAFTGKSEAHADKFAELFQQYFSDDELGEKNLAFSRAYNRLGGSIGDHRKTIQDHVNTGNRRHLEELGLIKDKTNNIDMDRLQEYFNEDGEPMPNVLDDTIPDPVPRRFNQQRRQRRQQPTPVPRVNLRRNRITPPTNEPLPLPVQGPNENFFTVLNTKVIDTIREINSVPILESIRNILLNIKEKINGTIPEEIIIAEEEVNPVPFNRKVKNQRNAPPKRKKTAPELREKRKLINTTEPIVPPDAVKPVSTTNNYKEIIDAIKDNSSKSISQVMSETLLRIEKKFNEGITLNGKRRGSSQPGENGPKRPWYAMSIGDILGGVTGAVGTGISKAAGLSGRIMGNAGSLAKTGWDFGKGLFDKGSKKVSTLGDIYVGDEKDPRLLAWKIKAGHYKDKLTGKVIKSLKDITGEVVDELNNTVISTKEDIEKAYTKLGNAKTSFISKMGATWKVIKDTSEKLSNSTLKGMGFFYDQAFSLAKKGYGLLDLPQDIYVEGKPDPVMLARTMKAGGYISRIAKAPVLVPSAIDGVILNDIGDIVLTAEEFAKGILDKHGKPIKTGVAKIMDIGKRLLTTSIDRAMAVGKMAANATIKGVKFAGKTISNIGQGIGDTMVNGIGSWGMFDRANAKRNNVGDLNNGVGGDSKGIIEKLNEIYALLKERLAIPKAKILGDADGDGDRDGSYKDIMSRQKKKEETKEEIKPGDPRYRGGKSLMATMGGGIKGLYDKIRGKNEDGEGDGSDININGDSDNRRSRRMQRRRSGPAPAGAWNKVKHYGGKAARGLGTAARWGGKAALGIAGLGGLGLGGIASAATSGIGAVLGGAGSLAAGAGSMLMAGGGTLLAGIGAMLASPVVLGALAVAAVGTAGYYGYKALTSKKLSDLSKVRYAQYGFLPTDTSHIETIFGLEDMLMAGVSYDKGMAKIDNKKVDLRKMMDSFGVSQGDEGGVKLWTTWFIERFKPVFLTHLTTLKAISPKTNLSDIEGMTPDEKLKYLNASKFPEGPYNVFASPFPDISSLSAGASSVTSLAELASVAITKEIKGAKDKPKTVSLEAAVASTAVLAANVDKFTGDNTTVPGMATGTAAVANGLIQKTEGVSGIGPIGNKITVAGVALGSSKFTSGKIDELTTIRFKAYGLLDMAIEKIKALDALEQAVNKKLIFGKDNAASWSGSVEEILDNVKSLFEISTVEGREGQSWQGWFSMRFLPTYMAYLSALCSTTNKTDPKTAVAALTPQQAFEVAMATQAAKNNGGESVWTVTRTPWWGFDLNTKMSSTDENMQALKNKSKGVVLDELTASVPDISKDAKKQNSVAAADGSTNNASRLPEVKVPSFWSKASTAVTDAAKYISSGIGNAASAVGGALSSAGSYVKSAVTNVFSGDKKANKDALLASMQKAAITNPNEQAMFMAQMDHESGGFRSLEENLNYKPAQFLKIFGRRAGISSEEQAKNIINQGPDSMAEVMYGGAWGAKNLGNTQPGDGGKYKGRSHTQLTGRDNYTRAGNALGIDLVNHPEKAAEPQTAAEIATWFWKSKKGLADAGKAGDVVGATKAINGGQIGLSDRQSKYTQYLQQAQTGNLLPSLSKGTIAPTGSSPTTAAVSPAKPDAGLVGGVVATAGAAAATANKTTTPTGLFPVADQTPGISTGGSSSPATAPVSKPAATNTGAMNNVDPNVVAAGTGFVNPRARDLNSQMQYQKDASAELLGSVNATLQTSNGIQQSQLDVLNSILKLMGMKPTGVIKDTKEAVVATVSPSRNTVSSPARAMSTPPVSMAKPVY